MGGPSGPRTLDLSPVPRTQETTLERTLGTFFDKHRQNQEQQRESDSLARIYKQYQEDGQNIENAFVNLQSDRNMSPTAKVKATEQLLGFHKMNQELQTNAQKQQQSFEKRITEQQEQKDNEERLRRAGASDKQIDLYNSAPVGGKTKVIEDIIEENSKKITPAEFQSRDLQDFDKGLTPNQRVKRQDERYKLQSPILKANSDSINTLENEGLSVDLLNELNESNKVGQGIRNINIHPKTGDLFLPKASTPEEQLFVKTINDFTVKAKDSFGARVTNFELDRFMQRLPTLANSEDGRRLILRQMKVINELNKIEKKAIQNVFDQYGVRNIDYPDAERIARKQISEERDQLKKEYLDYEIVARKEIEAYVQKIKEQTPSGRVAMRTPEGQYMHFDEKNKSALEEKGYVPL